MFFDFDDSFDWAAHLERMEREQAQQEAPKVQPWMTDKHKDKVIKEHPIPVTVEQFPAWLEEEVQKRAVRLLAEKKGKGEWKRIVRPVYSGFWRNVHNLVAHPMLAIYRPLGQKLHDYTAERMYEERPGVTPINTDSD